MRGVYGMDGNVAATIDSSGRVTLGAISGPIIGIVLADADVFAGETGGEWLGRVEPDGRIIDSQYQMVGRIDVLGRILDPTDRMLGKAERPVDGAVLILLVGRVSPETIAGPGPPSVAEKTIMDDVLSLAEEDSGPGIRKNYKPLTDEDVYGTPPPKRNKP